MENEIKTTEETVTTVDKYKKKAKAVIDTAKSKATEAWDWAVKNKESLVILVPVALAAAKGINGMIPKETQYERERRRVDETYYDPSTGCHWQLRRKMTNSEQTELVWRKRRGEPAEQILEDMGLLR